MKLPSKTPLIIMATIAIVAALVYFAAGSKDSGHGKSESPATADSVDSSEPPSVSGNQGTENLNNTNTAVLAPNSGGNTNSSGASPYPSVQGKSPEQLRRENQALVDLAERMKLKEKGQAQIKQIQQQMRKDEIASLKTSIENDQKLLKKIEDSGSGIDDYKYIEENLKIRRARLKELTR